MILKGKGFCPFGIHVHFQSLARVPLHPLLSFLRGPLQVPAPFENAFFGDQVSLWHRYHIFCDIGLFPLSTPPRKSVASFSAQPCTFPDAHLMDYCARTVVIFASVLRELQFGEQVPPQPHTLCDTTFCTECNLSGESTPTGLHRPWCPAHTYYVLPSGFPCFTFSQLITRDVCGSAICHLPKSSTVQPSKHSSCTVLGQSLRGHFLVGFLDMPSAFLWWFIFLCTMV